MSWVIRYDPYLIVVFTVSIQVIELVSFCMFFISSICQYLSRIPDICFGCVVVESRLSPFYGLRRHVLAFHIFASVPFVIFHPILFSLFVFVVSVSPVGLLPVFVSFVPVLFLASSVAFLVPVNFGNVSGLLFLFGSFSLSEHLSDFAHVANVVSFCQLITNPSMTVKVKLFVNVNKKENQRKTTKITCVCI